MEISGLLLQNISPHYSQDSILHIYKTQVLCIVEYACIVWDPHHKKDQLLLPTVCCQIGNKILVSGSDIPVPPPMNCCSNLKLIFAFKVLNSHVFCCFVLFTYHPQPNLELTTINNNYCTPLLQRFPFHILTLSLLLNCGILYLLILLL